MSFSSDLAHFSAPSAQINKKNILKNIFFLMSTKQTLHCKRSSGITKPWMVLVSLILPSLVSYLNGDRRRKNLPKSFYLLIYFLVPPRNCLRELDFPKKVCENSFWPPKSANGVRGFLNAWCAEISMLIWLEIVHNDYTRVGRVSKVTGEEHAMMVRLKVSQKVHGIPNYLF
jgi:hypothetical protein